MHTRFTRIQNGNKKKHIKKAETLQKYTELKIQFDFYIK